MFDQESRAKLPELSENIAQRWEAKAQVKFFTPDGSWVFYASEFDGENTFYGLVLGTVTVLGYFSLSGLNSLRVPGGVPVKRDVNFEPKTLRELKELKPE